MGQDEPGAAMFGGIDNDLAQREFGGAFIAPMAGQMNALRLIVDVRDPQRFTTRIFLGEASSEKGSGGGKPT